jgi:hypothetical protein
MNRIAALARRGLREMQAQRPLAAPKVAEAGGEGQGLHIKRLAAQRETTSVIDGFQEAHRR